MNYNSLGLFQMPSKLSRLQKWVLVTALKDKIKERETDRKREQEHGQITEMASELGKIDDPDMRQFIADFMARARNAGPRLSREDILIRYFGVPVQEVELTLTQKCTMMITTDPGYRSSYVVLNRSLVALERRGLVRYLGKRRSIIELTETGIAVAETLSGLKLPRPPGYAANSLPPLRELSTELAVQINQTARVTLRVPLQEGGSLHALAQRAGTTLLCYLAQVFNHEFVLSGLEVSIPGSCQHLQIRAKMPVKDAQTLASAAERANVSPEIYLRRMLRKELATKGTDTARPSCHKLPCVEATLGGVLESGIEAEPDLEIAWELPPAAKADGSLA